MGNLARETGGGMGGQSLLIREDREKVYTYGSQGRQGELREVRLGHFFLGPGGGKIVRRCGSEKAF